MDIDITKCKGTNCTLKESCFRFTASENEVLQAYFVEPPIKDGKCEMFWGESQNGIYNQLIKILNHE